ncbi:hypothetical protein LX32DRAFT_643796 [Colletotrichum zoysiae]|uniref:Uncharacterized protein n=1 Tax=Colletotrichum zoysiae TaxID=1216348 RepID=A0AAD9H8S0_9PEZI|nr:hypothetical protein LX32DRAFT_643796 [Colletotrichum zoysiae]
MAEFQVRILFLILKLPFRFWIRLERRGLCLTTGNRHVPGGQTPAFHNLMIAILSFERWYLAKAADTE